MKKVIVLFALIVAFAATSFAQTDNQPAPTTQTTEKVKGGKKRGHHGKQGAMNMKKELNLTSEQETKMKNIAATYRGKMKAVKTDAGDKTQKRAEAAEIHKAHEAEIKSILNAEQYAKYTELKKQRRTEMMAKRGGKGRKGAK